jgi:hypothetical protein
VQQYYGTGDWSSRRAEHVGASPLRGHVRRRAKGSGWLDPVRDAYACIYCHRLHLMKPERAYVMLHAPCRQMSATRSLRKFIVHFLESSTAVEIELHGCIAHDSASCVECQT